MYLLFNTTLLRLRVVLILESACVCTYMSFSSMSIELTIMPKSVGADAAAHHTSVYRHYFTLDGRRLLRIGHPRSPLH